jgi:hypothetical protein
MARPSGTQQSPFLHAPPTCLATLVPVAWTVVDFIINIGAHSIIFVSIYTSIPITSSEGAPKAPTAFAFGTQSDVVKVARLARLAIVPHRGHVWGRAVRVGRQVAVLLDK